MHWTFDDYLDQPMWFVEELIMQLNDEQAQRERELRKQSNG